AAAPGPRDGALTSESTWETLLKTVQERVTRARAYTAAPAYRLDVRASRGTGTRPAGPPKGSGRPPPPALRSRCAALSSIRSFPDERQQRRSFQLQPLIVPPREPAATIFSAGWTRWVQLPKGGGFRAVKRPVAAGAATVADRTPPAPPPVAATPL